ncbi:hypothetical protein [Psychroserpens algicola]|uniref:PepSY-associated TM region n=1 Tax=Psychroserpens algicola TaxID=1719034 RepID=A0ABT0HD86_9FLAO|nr:hypothetical protein [Psychroserpens algicola]MCK8482326.1 hypothetical protein [Psychroserpens algicola]
MLKHATNHTQNRYLQAEEQALMTKTSLKIISIIFGVIAIYFCITLIHDRTKKQLTAFNKEFSFEKKINISEKFTTDFESSYHVGFSLENPSHYKNIDSILPIETELEILHNGKPIELFGNNSFMSKAGTEYELKLNLINANSKPNKLRVGIEVDVPSPIYELMFEREYKWVYWTIDGIIFLIALITGYFGFQKKASR